MINYVFNGLRSVFKDHFNVLGDFWMKLFLDVLGSHYQGKQKKLSHKLKHAKIRDVTK